MSRSHAPRRLAALVGVLVLILVPACGVQIPSDPDGTLETVTGGVLRAGASPHQDLVQVDGDGVSGTEPELVESFAEHLDAEVAWTVSGEEALVRGLEDGSLDLVVGGITDRTPWVEQVGTTRPYTTIVGPQGGSHDLVMLVAQGENAFLSELERFLDENAGSP